MNARDRVAAELVVDGWVLAREWGGIVTLTRGPWAVRLGRDDLVRIYQPRRPSAVGVELRRQEPGEVVRIVRAICAPDPWDGAA